MIRNVFSLALTLILLTTPLKAAAQADSGAEWPCFRGPTGMGVSKASGLPLTWSQTENLTWKTPLPGAGSSSPIVYGDHIYVTCYMGHLVPGVPGGSVEDLKRSLLAISKNDGKVIWRKDDPAKLPEKERIRDHGYAANTPAADTDGVVVFHGRSGVIAYDHSGKQLWRADVGSGTSGWGSSGSLVIHKGRVIVNACVESDSLIALDRKTGREEWRAEGIRESWSTPVVVKASSGREELILSAKPQILAFNPESGERLWACDTDISWYIVPTVIESEGVVYALGGRSGTSGLAVRTGGKGDVTSTHRLWTSKKGSNVTSPVFHNGHLYWMHEKRGIAFCAKPESGELVYEHSLERAGQIYASALLAENRIYYLNRRGRTFVVAAKPEFELLATNELADGSLFNGSPAVSGNHILLRSDKYLYCLGKGK